MRDALGRFPPGHQENADRGRDEAGRYRPIRDNVHRIAVISDLHYGSLYQQATRLKEFLAYAMDRNCEKILCCGDISDGLKMREHHDYEMFLHTGDDIIDYIAEEYPDHDCKTLYITGNHDNALWKHCGIDLGKALERQRSDMRFVGYAKADISIPGGVKVRLHHGAGGCGENRSLRIQKQSLKAMEECMANGQIPPDIFLAGHCHHEAVVHNYFNMFIMSLPCFQGQTPYLAERGMISQCGGVVLEYQADGEGLISTPKVDYQQFAPIKNDYPGWKSS